MIVSLFLKRSLSACLALACSPCLAPHSRSRCHFQPHKTHTHTLSHTPSHTHAHSRPLSLKHTQANTHQQISPAQGKRLPRAHTRTHAHLHAHIYTCTCTSSDWPGGREDATESSPRKTTRLGDSRPCRNNLKGTVLVRCVCVCV